MIPTIREHLISAWHAVLDHCSDSGKAAKSARHARWESAREKRQRADIAKQQVRNVQDRHNKALKLQQKQQLAAVQSTLPPNVFICQFCGASGHPKRKVQGSFLVEVLLWLLFCAPGLIYSAWRLTSAQSVCHSCESPNMIRARSPRGQELWNYYHRKN